MRQQLYGVFQTLPPKVPCVLASSTLPSEVLEISSRFMRNPVRILVPAESLLLDTIRHCYVAVEKEEWKFDTLCDLLEASPAGQTCVFCNFIRKVDWLADLVNRRDFQVDVS